MTAVMSAANEKAVEVFLAERIRYLDIVPLVSACCEAHQQVRTGPDWEAYMILQENDISPYCCQHTIIAGLCCLTGLGGFGCAACDK